MLTKERIERLVLKCDSCGNLLYERGSPGNIKSLDIRSSNEYTLIEEAKAQNWYIITTKEEHSNTMVYCPDCCSKALKELEVE